MACFQRLHTPLLVASLVTSAALAPGCSAPASRSSATPDDPHEVRAPEGSDAPGDPVAPDPAPTPGGPESPAAQEPTSEPGHGRLAASECERLLDHLLAIARDEQARTVPPEQVPTDEQVAGIRARMKDAFMVTCQQMSREEYDCTVQARDRAGMNACTPGVQPGEP